MPDDWWREALASDEPMVTTRDWKHVGGEHIVMNTAAMLLMIEAGPGSSYEEYIDNMVWPDEQ